MTSKLDQIDDDFELYFDYFWREYVLIWWEAFQKTDDSKIIVQFGVAGTYIL